MGNKKSAIGKIVTYFGIGLLIVIGTAKLTELIFGKEIYSDTSLKPLFVVVPVFLIVAGILYYRYKKG